MCSKSKPWSPGTGKYCVLLFLLILTEAKISDIITCMSQPARWPSRSSSESFLFCGGDLTLRRPYLIASFFLQGTEGCLALGCHHIQGEPQVQRMVPQLFTSPNGPGTGWLITPRFIQWETAAPRGDTSWRPQWGLGLWGSNSGQLGSLITSLLFPSPPDHPDAISLPSVPIHQWRDRPGIWANAAQQGIAVLLNAWPYKTDEEYVDSAD